MEICVVGLGLIGGSVCLSLKRGGHKIFGYDISENVMRYAADNGVIDFPARDFSSFGVVIVALPPRATLDFILKTPFKSGAVVCDMCGVKRFIQSGVYAARRDIKYIGAHPMAGKEVSGVENACADLFDGANMVLIRGIYTDECAYELLMRLSADMGFARVVECSAEVHDKKIAYTSQLAHVVSNSYVNDGEISACLGFTGGSFQDMTRIAGVDEKMWASLFLENADNLRQKCENLIESLQSFNAALDKAEKSGDESVLSSFLSVGARKYRAGKAEEFSGEGITVHVLEGRKR